VTCMDARIDPAAALGINLGDAHVIRNAGGNARDALRSIIISQQLLGTKEIVLVKHTDCGMVTFQNSDVHDKVKKNLGPAAEAEIGTLDFQPFPDVEQAVKNDVEYLRKSATVADDVVLSGWIYDVHSGKVTKLV
jgi:carbonic anhydrase